MLNALFLSSFLLILPMLFFGRESSTLSILGRWYEGILSLPHSRSCNYGIAVEIDLIEEDLAILCLDQRGGFLGVSEDGDGGDLLAPRLVLDSDDGDLEDGGVAEEGALHIQRAYFVSAGP